MEDPSAFLCSVCYVAPSSGCYPIYHRLPSGYLVCGACHKKALGPVSQSTPHWLANSKTRPRGWGQDNISPPSESFGFRDSMTSISPSDISALANAFPTPPGIHHLLQSTPGPMQLPLSRSNSIPSMRSSRRMTVGDIRDLWRGLEERFELATDRAGLDKQTLFKIWHNTKGDPRIRRARDLVLGCFQRLDSNTLPQGDTEQLIFVSNDMKELFLELADEISLLPGHPYIPQSAQSSHRWTLSSVSQMYQLEKPTDSLANRSDSSGAAFRTSRTRAFSRPTTPPSTESFGRRRTTSAAGNLNAQSATFLGASSQRLARRQGADQFTLDDTPPYMSNPAYDSNEALGMMPPEKAEHPYPPTYGGGGNDARFDAPGPLRSAQPGSMHKQHQGNGTTISTATGKASLLKVPFLSRTASLSNSVKTRFRNVLNHNRPPEPQGNFDIVNPRP